MNDRQIAISTNAVIGEIITDASLDALNGELLMKKIQAERIVSIFFLPGQPVANGVPSRFRILYRL